MTTLDMTLDNRYITHIYLCILHDSLALQNLVCGFYGLMVFVLGFSFIAADAIGNNYAHEQEYVMVTIQNL